MNKLCKLIAASTSHSLITTEQHLTLKEDRVGGVLKNGIGQFRVIDNPCHSKRTDHGRCRDHRPLPGLI